MEKSTYNHTEQPTETLKEQRDKLQQNFDNNEWLSEARRAEIARDISHLVFEIDYRGGVAFRDIDTVEDILVYESEKVEAAR